MGRVLAFDIEADGLAEIALDGKGQCKGVVSKLHCLVAIDVATNEEFLFRPHQMREAWEFLKSAHALVAHNGIGYDIPVMERFMGERLPESVKVIDTLIMARMTWPDRQSNPAGGYSLKAVGDFFGGEQKSDYEGGWAEFSQEMLDYCVQDVRTTVEVFHKLMRNVKNGAIPKDSLEMEHKFAKIIAEQTERGWAFDIDRGEKLLFSILSTKRGLEDELRAIFPDRREELKSCEYWIDPETDLRYTTKGEVKGKGSGAIKARLVPGPNKFKLHPFNPSSSMQIAVRLEEKYGWKAERNPKTDKPICDVAVMQSLKFPEAKKLLEYREVDKLRGQLEDWIARAGMSRDGRIHGGLNTLGTVTGRTAASQPNIQQVSGNKDARSLWTVADGMVQVGCDLSGLELRALAHYMEPYDGGEYADVILNGDIHTQNQTAAGLQTRDQAKTFIYALIYGGGNGKMGEIIGGSAAEGGRLKDRFFKSIPAIKKLIDGAATAASSDGAIELLDGRVVPVRSEHKALNVLLQGCGAIISKWWAIIANDRVKAAGLRAWQIGFIHDEMQWECHPEDVAALSKILEDASISAGEHLNIRMPIEAEASHGANWSDCH